MENASKAILISGGILLAMIILTAVVLNYNKIVDFYNSDKNMTEAEQVAKYNAQYTQYNRKDVKGFDVLSLINKVANNKIYKEDEKMQITITIPADKKSDFYYKPKSEYRTQAEYIQTLTTINNLSEANNKIGSSYTENNYDNQLKKVGYNVLSTAVEGIKSYSGLSEGNLQLLTKKISVLFSDSSYEANIVKRNDILDQFFGNHDSDTLEKAQISALEYYQITQFKRAHFECTNIGYDDVTGKVNSLVFEFKGKFS